MGFEVISAEGYDNKGTFAFFKAYQELRGKVDAVYVGPMWACDAEKIRQFFILAGREGVPSFSWRNDAQVGRGALAAGSGRVFVWRPWYMPGRRHRSSREHRPPIYRCR
jgi:hypothetical protein